MDSRYADPFDLLSYSVDLPEEIVERLTHGELVGNFEFDLGRILVD